MTRLEERQGPAAQGPNGGAVELRRQLNRTWYAFLAHHPHPRPIQVRAAAPILEGRPVLLASATASGKTEAYAAPLVERWFERCARGEPKILIVGPTRALVNDLARRLEGPLRRCGIGLLRRTGDHPNDLTAEAAGVIVTTPESLDSVLSRHPRWLGSTGSVVLDELHVLQGTPRGDQLLCLLERLERVVVALGGPAPQRIAATATAANPEEVAARYLGQGAVVLCEESQRDFDLHLADCTSPAEMLKSLAERCRALGARKVLCFMPSRQEAEIYGAKLLGRPPFQTRVFVHHGSLSRQERERVEKAFLKAPSALCLATNTLELGIDIGDVDMVALFGAPPEVSSFLQRIGRGNRRGGRCQVLGLCRHPGEHQRMAHLGECAAEGRLYVDPDRPFRSVAVQQIFSLLFQNPRRQIALAPLVERLPAWLELDCHALERIL
ncbi:MAG: DEAD/DEAH box helicase, partial [Candidatus Eremiobacteraeota bacterium]|nr:DEAD/DEAH box helicase [Candidatus Eremiobacteraeota bacterium]